MKLKHVSILLALFLSFSFTALSQPEDEEVQMYSFGSSRSLGANHVHDFGAIKNLSTFTIELQNTEDTKMYISDINMPSGVGVTILQKALNSGEKGGIVVTIDPKFMKKGDFKKRLIINTITKNTKGVVIKKTAAFNLRGQVL